MKTDDRANQVMLVLQVDRVCAASRVNMVLPVIQFKANRVRQVKTAMAVTLGFQVNPVCLEDLESICATASHARLVLSARLGLVVNPANLVKMATPAVLVYQVNLVFPVKMPRSVIARMPMAM